MSSIIFFSDTHLNISEPSKTQRVINFLHKQKPKTVFYILGDFFDLWIGPKHLELEDYREIITELKSLTVKGYQINFIPGNRDFQLGPEITAAAGVNVLPEIVNLNLDSNKVLLTHGDIFCTEDKSYQSYRRVSRSRIVKNLYQSLPQNLGLKLGRGVRNYSKEVVPRKGAAGRNLIESVLMRYFKRGRDTIICGHVHNSQIREIGPGKILMTVGSWERQGSYIEYDKGQFTLKNED